jgi:hypothetical protein
MTPFSQAENVPYFSSFIQIFRVWMWCAAGLFCDVQLHMALGQQVQPESTLVIFSKMYTTREMPNNPVATLVESRPDDTGLSPRFPKVPTVSEMTGKMGRGEILLQNSNSKVNASPSDHQMNGETESQRAWVGQATTWAAPNFYSHPLYFEQTNLERYHSKLPPCAVPLVSYAHFLGSVPLLPYQAGYKHPTERSYSLGHWRPGDSVPSQIHWTPFTKRGLLYQGAATSGALLLLP